MSAKPKICLIGFGTVYVSNMSIWTKSTFIQMRGGLSKMCFQEILDIPILETFLEADLG